MNPWRFVGHFMFVQECRLSILLCRTVPFCDFKKKNVSISSRHFGIWCWYLLLQRLFLADVERAARQSTALCLSPVFCAFSLWPRLCNVCVYSIQLLFGDLWYVNGISLSGQSCTLSKHVIVGSKKMITYVSSRVEFRFSRMTDFHLTKLWAFTSLGTSASGKPWKRNCFEFD